MTAPTGYSQSPSGFFFSNDGSGPYWLDSSGSVRSFEPATEQRNPLAPSNFRDVTTTRQSVAFPGGARVTVLQYRLLPGATAVANQLLRIALNASSDLDAAGKLATSGAYLLLCQGDDLTLVASATDPIYRIDFLTEQAVGAEKTLLQIFAGV